MALRAPGGRFDPYAQNNFDLLRFVAASLVLVDHSFVLTGRPGPPGPLGYETLGGFAVAVFFAVSGFLVCASWEREPRLGAFARKRALRILPAFVAVVALCALVAHVSRAIRAGSFVVRVTLAIRERRAPAIARVPFARENCRTRPERAGTGGRAP